MQDLQLDFFDIPSPCVGVCQSDAKGTCLGCFRTRAERFNWVELKNSEKQRVIKRCHQREKRRNSPAKVKVVEEEPSLQQPSLLDPPIITDKIDIQISENDFDDFEL